MKPLVEFRDNLLVELPRPARVDPFLQFVDQNAEHDASPGPLVGQVPRERAYLAQQPALCLHGVVDANRSKPLAECAFADTGERGQERIGDLGIAL